MARKNQSIFESLGWEDYIAPAAIVGVGLYFWNDLKKILFSGERKERREAEEKVQKSELTYNDSEYKVFAKSLFTAMDGGGTNWAVIVNTMDKMKTASDFWKLHAAFGIKESTSIISNFSGNLIQWIIDELSDHEMSIIRKKLESIGITAA